ncbi:MAG: hypothetical protein HRT58_00170 [Crocinitomicaceae bacterium]|nr:hypothetical protein [Flavobacteriales bacterium]NQZ34035.1 hypothetical protein [Crocinitomicaceae bacterium]
MKKLNRKKLNGDRLGLIFTLAFLIAIGIFWYVKGTSLNKYGECTVGTIDYLGGTSMGYRAFYKYRVNGKLYQKYSPISRKSKELVIPGKKFVVKYERGDPSNSAVFLSVPILDESSAYEIPKNCCDTLTEVFGKI